MAPQEEHGPRTSCARTEDVTGGTEEDGSTHEDDRHFHLESNQQTHSPIEQQTKVTGFDLLKLVPPVTLSVNSLYRWEKGPQEKQSVQKGKYHKST